MKAILNGTDYGQFVLDKGGFIIAYERKKQGTDRVSIDGTKYSGSDGRKAVISISTVPMSESQLSDILSNLSDKYAQFIYDDPLLGKNREIEVIPSVTQVQIAIENYDKESYYYGISFSLEER